MTLIDEDIVRCNACGKRESLKRVLATWYTTQPATTLYTGIHTCPTCQGQHDPNK